MKTLLLLLVTSSIAFAQTESAILTWDPNPPTDYVTGYTLSWGTEPGVYDKTRDITEGTMTIVSDLQVGMTYYFVVRAYNPGAAGPDSDEIAYKVEWPVPGKVVTMKIQRNSTTQINISMDGDAPVESTK